MVYFVLSFSFKILFICLFVRFTFIAGNRDSFMLTHTNKTKQFLGCNWKTCRIQGQYFLWKWDPNKAVRNLGCTNSGYFRKSLLSVLLCLLNYVLYLCVCVSFSFTSWLPLLLNLNMSCSVYPKLDSMLLFEKICF